jgi:hypothetical protein
VVHLSASKTLEGPTACARKLLPLDPSKHGNLNLVHAGAVCFFAPNGGTNK